MSRVFDRFAPFIQDFIYAHEWESLRGVQVAAAEAIFDTDAHVLLTSGTASGKTEAAFFPILTEFWETPPTSVGAIYIGPLKALINDQFYRLQDLCEEADINVWHWHGDVSASHKARLMKKPSGILQITPESLEAMLMRRHSAIPHLFGDLRYIVVDEVHSLLRGDRGGQTLCLMERLCRLANVSPRRICLSATIGDPEAVARLISWGTGRTCVIPQIAGANQRWRIMMEHFYTSGPQASHATPHVTGATQHVDAIVEEVDERALPQDTAAMVVQGPDGEDPFDATEEGASGVPAVWDPGIAYVYTHSRGRKCLVFSNSREDCEAMCSTLRSYCEADGEPDRFLIHHGNLSASFRETAEELMRDEELMLTCCTTATLELGIDIGRLERAFQMDAPFTVSAFLQRMGRTGRRGAPPEMAFVIREDPPEPRALVAETVPWKLLQAIALVELYLKERYVEPPRLDRLPFSLLYHQTMSTLASSGEMSAAELASRVLTLPYFHRITPDDYRVLLRHLLEIDHIERTETGGLIVGLAGERVTNGFRFYGVFVESEEYTVRSESAELGTVVQPPPIGEKLAICGSVWIVEDIDHKRRIVECTQVKGKVPAYFGECPGDIQTKVLERMRMVLTEPGDFRYLSDNARARLAHARTVATYAHIGREPLINLGGDMWALFPWLGTYAFLALERTIKLRMPAELGIKGVDVSRPYFIQMRMRASAEEFMDALRRAFEQDFDPLELVYPGEVPVFDKYDEYVPEELVRKGFAYGVLDVDGARERVLGW